MPNLETAGRVPLAKRIFNALQVVFRITYLFLAAIIFVLLTAYAFWVLPQGRDMTLAAMENTARFTVTFAAIFFWAGVSWYSCRLVAEKKLEIFPEFLPRRVFFYAHRFIGFACYNVMIVAFLPLPEKGMASYFFLLFAVEMTAGFYYFRFLNNYLYNRYKNYNRAQCARLVNITLTIMALAITLSILIFYLLKRGNGGQAAAAYPARRIIIVTLLLIMQHVSLVLVVLRRRIIRLDGEALTGTHGNALTRTLNRIAPVSNFIKKNHIAESEKTFFFVFNLLSAAILILYISAIIWVVVAVNIGPLPFVLLAFSVILGIANIISRLSIRRGLNFHIVLLLFAFLFGLYKDPHRVNLIQRSKAAPAFSQRDSLGKYFTEWVRARQHLADSNGTLPLYFVMANGGASRSGYWTASVLAKLQDSTNGQFGRHLFCLSGASGGSLGNALFFSQLSVSLADSNAGNNNRRAVQEYLGSDFLTYTLARMLGPDIYQSLWPAPNNIIGDRAGALTRVLENAEMGSDTLQQELRKPFSDFIGQKGMRNYQLPILCINTTRMQDGSPAVFSNIIIDPNTFNNRLDVLATLDTLNSDIKLSSAVVLGASFPYISPAGRIGDHYFVDGGYFDNSGAGVVMEMLMELDRIIETSEDPLITSRKFSFNIIHIVNDSFDETVLGRVNPLVNDLAAPITTLMGSYGQQTSINDLRMQRFIKYYLSRAEYLPISLYRQAEDSAYSMNWYMSQITRERINRRLDSNSHITDLIMKMRDEF